MARAHPHTCRVLSLLWPVPLCAILAGCPMPGTGPAWADTQPGKACPAGSAKGGKNDPGNPPPGGPGGQGTAGCSGGAATATATAISPNATARAA